jgi:hypothetical protein
MPAAPSAAEFSNWPCCTIRRGGRIVATCAIIAFMLARNTPKHPRTAQLLRQCGICKPTITIIL